MSFCKIFGLKKRTPRITTITIPPDKVGRMETRIVPLIIQYGGEPLDVNFGEEKGSFVYTATFFNNNNFQKFCDAINKDMGDGCITTP